MSNSIIKFEQPLSRIARNLEQIKQDLPSIDGPVFVELIGTPKSGKTTLLKQFKKLFDTSRIPICIKQETAEYNPIEDKDIEEYNIWMYMELMKNLSEDLSDKTPRIIIYDRGILDRLPWLDFSVRKGNISSKDNELLKKLYETEFVQKYKPLSYVLFTSPEISIERKGKPGRLVNNINITVFNKCLKDSIQKIKDLSCMTTTQETDGYQGKLSEFIIDMNEKVTHDLSEIIRERKQKEIVDEEKIISS